MPNWFNAQNFLPFFFFCLFLFFYFHCGNFVCYMGFPRFWPEWIKFLSFIRYCVSVTAIFIHSSSLPSLFMGTTFVRFRFVYLRIFKDFLQNFIMNELLLLLFIVRLWAGRCFHLGFYRFFSIFLCIIDNLFLFYRTTLLILKMMKTLLPFVLPHCLRNCHHKKQKKNQQKSTTLWQLVKRKTKQSIAAIENFLNIELFLLLSIVGFML